MENKVEEHHLKFMEWHYLQVATAPASCNYERDNLTRELKKVGVLNTFGSSYVDDNNNCCLIIDGPYDPAKSQVWAIFECPACHTRKMGIQTIGRMLHVSNKHINCALKPDKIGDSLDIEDSLDKLRNIEGYFYILVKRNLTWQQARQEKRLDDDIFGLGVPVKDKEQSDIDVKSEWQKFVKILDERAKV